MEQEKKEPEMQEEEAAHTPAVTPLMHSYKEDLSQAMQVSQPEVVQELMTLAKEKELAQKSLQEHTSGGWRFFVGAGICFLVSGVALWYVLHTHQARQMVPLTTPSLQARFQELPAVVIEASTIRAVVRNATAYEKLERNVPRIIPLVSQNATGPLTPQVFFNFLETDESLPETLVSLIEVARLGVVATGEDADLFLLLSGSDPELLPATLFRADSSFLRAFYRALGLDIARSANLLDIPLSDEYVDNVPVRVLRAPSQETILLYGILDKTIAIITTSEDAFSAVYAALVRPNY